MTSGDILAQDVSVLLDNGTALLAPVTFQARRGGVTAVLGPNGSGKTTLVELLLRFRVPATGRILIDGQDITHVSLSSLRSQIGLVAQDAALFDGTLRENVAYGLPSDAPEEVLERGARLAGLDQLVRRLPAGWATRVGRGGRHLSSSQRRQVALARTLATDPPILVLDEPTTGLDTDAENTLARLLQSLAREKTILIVAQRLPASLLPAQTFPLAPLAHGRPAPAPDAVTESDEGEEESDDD